MTVIQIKNKSVLAVPVMFRIVLKMVYDVKNVTNQEYENFESSLKLWKNAIQLEKDRIATESRGMLFGADEQIIYKYSEQEKDIEALQAFLVADARGQFDQRKADFKRMNIDYKKFHRLPEAYTAADFAKGAEILKESNRREGIDDSHSKE